MEYRKLGRTDLITSFIGLGTLQFGGELGKQFTQIEIDRIIAAAADSGINFVDTAECYGHHQVESLIGKAIGENRKHWIVATKFGHIFNNFMDRIPYWSPKSVTEQLERFLKALGTDYVDLYQFHSGNNKDFDEEGLWMTLERHVKSGKIRYLGISIQHALVINDDLYQIKSAEKVKAQTIQVVYNRLSRDAERLLLPYCKKNGLGVIARIPLARGFLGGKYSIEHMFPANDLRSKQNKKMTTDMINDVEEIKKREVPESMDMAQYALQWILRQPGVTTCVVSCKNVEQVKKNSLEGLDLEYKQKLGTDFV